MSGYALLLKNLGFEVSASDLNDSYYFNLLAENGIRSWLGSKPENIKENSIVFHSTAVPEHDAERKAASEKKMAVFSRHPLLSFLTEKYFTIAISGTHGKTTTTGWLAYALEQAGLDPTALVGGKLLNWQSHFRLGQGQVDGKPILVIEADESDRSFHYIHADIAALTNIDLDHVDTYDKEEDALAAFDQFFEQTAAAGGQLATSPECSSMLERFGQSDGAQRILNKIEINQQLHYEQQPIAVGLAGQHNLFNAALVISLCQMLGASNWQQPLASFQGVGRRLETLYDETRNGSRITVVDDYAHHPREMAAALDTIRPAENQHLAIFWEPHRISRLTYFYKEFKQVIEKQAGWQHLYVLPTFNAGGETPDYPGYDNCKADLDGHAVASPPEKAQLAELLKGLQKKHQSLYVIFMGAGHSSEWAHEAARLFSGQS